MNAKIFYLTNTKLEGANKNIINIKNWIDSRLSLRTNNRIQSTFKLLESCFKLVTSAIFDKHILLHYRGTLVFPPGQTNLKRNPGDNPGVGSIPFKSIVTFKQAQWDVELSIRQVLEAGQNQLVLIALSEATCIQSIGHRLMIPYTGRDGQDEVEKMKTGIGNSWMWRFPPLGGFITFFAGQSDSRQEPILEEVV